MPPLSGRPSHSEGSADSALAATAALIESDELTPAQCAEALALAVKVPGRQRELCDALARTPSDAAAAALLELPREIPGRTEAVYRAFRRGARRTRPGGASPHMLAFEFRRSKAGNFDQVLSVIDEHFHAQIEHLQVEGKARFRFRIDPLFAARGGAALQTQLAWIQPRLAKWAGTRMWLNGWAFDRKGPVSVQAHGPLMGAWLDWARGSVHTRRRVEIA